jgi:maltose alpha-D-glucosyltransferase/alpha-amylase
MTKKATAPLEDDPLWYKDGVIYQLHVRAFFDSDGDGVGDFEGLTTKLDYLQDLGVTALWLLPFYPSPLRDDGYDIADYNEVNPTYGTLRDFKAFMKEAHRRGMRVITELVINHTSDQHPWFQRSRNAKPGSNHRDFYVWSDTPDKYKEARIIFKDFETSNWSWDPVAGAYFWHRFYHHQPDLNFDNPQVKKAVSEALDFWMEMGVDGLRLDAVPYLYEREGTTGENLPETHQYLKELRRHVDARFKNRMLLAEANQWPEDSRPYFGDGDECHVAFHFPLMPRLFMSVAMEDRFPIVDIIQQTPDIPDNCQWAVFLRNHDELTLEMVTDEDRDYMWRTYAQDPQARINLGIRRRLAPLLNNHRRRIELLNGLLFSFPGTPVIYYGDEIGMGDNIYLGDRNGVRTPMQWSADRNAGFSRANPQRLFLPITIDPEYHYESINVEAQQNNSHSLLWWMKRLIDLRKRFKAFGRGTLEFLHPENRKVLTFIRTFEDERILVVANLSRFVQAVELDLSAYKGMVPEELFGHTEFPSIGELPYFVTLGPFDFYWFRLQPGASDTDKAEHALPSLQGLTLDDLLTGRTRTSFANVLARYIRQQRWFASKTRDIKSARIVEVVPIDAEASALLFVRLEYQEGAGETYLVPVACAEGDGAASPAAGDANTVMAKLRARDRDGVVYEAVWNRDLALALLRTVLDRKQLKASDGIVRGWSSREFRHAGDQMDGLEPVVLKADQSNTAIVFSDRYFLKLFRRLESGVSPDFEISRFLTEKTDFACIPRLVGALEYRRDNGEVSTLAIAQQAIPNHGDSWKYTLDAVGQSFDRALGLDQDKLRELVSSVESPLELLDRELPPLVADVLGTYLGSAELMGRRIGELHVALASRSADPAFAPEPFTPHYQRSIYQHMRTQATQAFAPLKKKLRDLPADTQEDAALFLAAEGDIRDRFRSVLDGKITALRTRLHGDLHLGQILYTGKDFVIIDFEGEPSRPLSERGIKRSPLRDVAGMLRSFQYASYAVLMGHADGVNIRVDDEALLEPVARLWHRWVSAVFLKAYLDAGAAGGFLPKGRREVRTLLEAYLLEKALYELNYELNNRPGWVRIPLRGMLELLGRGGE